MRIYLDNCCFNRPFDDQQQARVRLEAEAKLYIQERIRNNTIEIAWSYILDLENSANPFEERRTTIQNWRQFAKTDVEESPALLKRANALSSIGLKAKDALHVACAIAAGCDYFVTTDDGILALGKVIMDIIVLDPTALVRERNI